MGGIREQIKKIGRMINRWIPKNQNKILFESHSDYCDNTRALYDYLEAAGYQSRRFVWCVENPASPPEKLRADGVKLVSFRSKRHFPAYFFQMATAGTVVFSHYPPPFVNPACQRVLNLWHGTPLKTLKGHVPPAHIFSFLLSPGDLFDPILAESFGARRDQLLQLGYPRNDLLFARTDALERLGISPGSYRKVLLWMPTFRRPAGGGYQDAETTPTGLPLIETPALLLELNSLLAEHSLYLVIKLHPGQDLSGVELARLSHIRMLTNKELDEAGVQLYHLVARADVLLTDYSSIYFDYLLLDRPIGFLIDDFEIYEHNRGFTVENPLDLMPGEKIRTKEDLFAFLSGLGGEDAWASERQRVNRLVNRWQDGNSSKRCAEYFFGQP